MVFSSISESDSPAASTPMASIVSGKSQPPPLHNFSLTDLKWSPAHNRLRRLPVDFTHRSSLRDFAPRPAGLDTDTCRHRAINDLPPPGPTRNTAGGRGEKDVGKPEPVAAAVNGRPAKILLRLPVKEKPANPPAEAEAKAEAEAPVAQRKPPASPAEPEELTSKVWNLRPRKRITKKSSNGGAPGQEIRPLVEGSGRSGAEVEKGMADERKVKFSIPLTKEEIEADFLAMTGSRPVRRPKKRPKIVQRSLDFCFPGLWLAAITPDSYKVVENPPKV